ncbi:peptidoglycan DD-metalloendopeptidase family protein [Halopseudomonas salegens]|uniref:Murein DD-endopeptidase MepM and murein hydrolase activator NlpD, contain LysM domain n=1 Tax=Halopseudomonas salegens TaxID=1434072 RepID=A0A1H2DZS0_9GAMM|nr:peptidoglycan DD-metalloendopeptidase family protein [Halopseudomonas salegens]SDT88341.1 Murein DD-endopeptidase MepM and murein hydrolase activator NlpD, contain LysM domain [Halopseudomonas salegens]
MGSPTNKTTLYPKSHILAASGIAAALSFFLLVIPSTDVEAHKTFIPLDLSNPETQSTSALSERVTSLLNDNVIIPLKDGDFGALTQAIHPADGDLIDQLLMANQEPPPLNNEMHADNHDSLGTTDHWTRLTVESGNTLSTVFDRVGIPTSTLYSVLDSSNEAKRFTRLRIGQILEFKLDDGGDLLALRSKLNDLETIEISRNGDGFVFNKELLEPEVRNRFAQGQINSSLFLAAQRAEMPHNLTMQMANIFGYDIDFAREIRQGDNFEVLFEEKHLDGKRVGTGNILAARFVNRGREYTAVRYVDRQGQASYYRADGTSMRRAFIRTPVEFARISSRFNPNRRHPILNTIRAHNGVDYAAPTGTPIKATGDGRIIHLGRKGGYGNTIVIRHGQQYQTLYAHMNGYARGLSNGSHVTQGQVIGYVGMTGLATGPHLHYEFLRSGRHVDPLRVDLPVADPVPDNERERFMEQSKQVMASLDQHRTTQLAMLDQ